MSLLVAPERARRVSRWKKTELGYVLLLVDVADEDRLLDIERSGCLGRWALKRHLRNGTNHTASTVGRIDRVGASEGSGQRTKGYLSYPADCHFLDYLLS